MVGIIMVPVESNRPANIIPIELGQTGTDQLRADLQTLGHLSSYIAGFINNQGTCFAPVEEDTTLEEALKFRTGLNGPTAAIRAWLAEYIAKQWGSNCPIVFEDSWMKKSDKVKRPPRQPCFFVDDTPCYAPQTGDLLSRLTAGKKETRSHCFAAFVIASSVELPPAGHDMTLRQKAFMAQNIHAILLSAYDKEGYVVWQKQK